jgi:predicted ArsR family transcriptional regulator
MLTIRQAIKELLQEEALSALEISQRLSLPEKEVLEHLTHLGQSSRGGLSVPPPSRRLQKLRFYF